MNNAIAGGIIAMVIAMLGGAFLIANAIQDGCHEITMAIIDKDVH